MTFSEFRDSVAESVWPDGEAENLVVNHRRYVVDALIDLQQKIPSLRMFHEDNTLQGSTYFHCGATVLPAPRGFIANVWTILDTDCCAKVYYDPVEMDEMRGLVADDKECADQQNLDIAYAYPDDSDGPGCLYYSDGTGSVDKLVRAERGYVAIHRGNLHLYPHLQSNEIAVVEWDGIKREWTDGDGVNFDREVQDAVEHYVEAKAARREDSDIAKEESALKHYHGLIIPKLIWQYRKENRIAKRVHHFSNCGLVSYCSTSSSTCSNTIIDEITDMEPLVETYAALRLTVNPSKYASAKVLGKSSAFDGGGGVFIRRTQTAPATADDDAVYLISTYPGYAGGTFWQKWL